MRPFQYALALGAFSLAVFWLGLIMHFPGESVARYVETRANVDPRLVVRLTPVSLHWNRLSVERIALSAVVRGEQRPVVAFLETEIPLSFGLIGGLTIQSAVEGGGMVEAYLPWDGGNAEIAGSGLRLEKLPALQWLETGRLEGRVSFAGTVSLTPPAKATLPEGRLDGRATALTIDGVQAAGLSIPETRLEELSFRVKLGKSILVEEFKVRGDIQGTVKGTINPVLERLPLSGLQLTTDLTFSPEWMARWGDLAPLIEGYLEGGRLRGSLRGNLQRPQFTKSRTR